MGGLQKMKKIFILLLLITILPLMAEENIKKIYGNERNTIYVNIFPLAIGQINAHYERLLDDKISVMLGLAAANRFLDISPNENWSIFTTFYKIGVGIYPSGRYGETLRGVYLMPSYTLIKINAKYKPESKSTSEDSYFIGLDIGYKRILKKGFLVDLSVGMGYKSEVVIKVEDKKLDELDKRVGITHIGLQIGYAW